MYYDYDEPYEPSDEEIARWDYEAELASEGIGSCRLHGTYDLVEAPESASHCWEDTPCPSCERRDEIQREIYAGERDADDICELCGFEESVTRFMGQRCCWPCYQTASTGNAPRDTLSFADPGGRSALRAAGPGNPRIYPCPTCYEPNRLTAIDRSRGYQCNSCADRAEGHYYGGDY